MDKHVDRREEWRELLKEAYGFADNQLAEEFDRMAESAKEEEPVPGNFEALKKRLRELDQNNSKKET